jgi:hypothetical protein
MVVVAAPVMDTPTIISSWAAKIVDEYARRKGYETIPLFGPLANSFSLLFINSNIFFYYGHGTKDSLIGEFIFLPMVSTLNVDRLRDKIVFTMACNSGKELGRLAVEKGAKCYLGAVTEMYAAFPASDRNYLDDWIYLQTIIPIGLLNGDTAGEAYNKYVSESLRYAKIYEDGYSNHTLPNGDYYAYTTRSNADNYILLGDPTVKIK